VGEETIKPETIEQKVAMVSDWVKNISEKQEVGCIDAEILRDVFKIYKADFKHLTEEERKSLSGYSEAERSLGVKQVWGKEKIKNYKSWVQKYIKEYDEIHEIKLPILGEKEGQPYPESGRKNSGMIQFLYELTSFASGETSFDDFKKYMEARVSNGVAWAEERKKDRVRVKVPTSENPILLSSVPKEFPIKAWEWIRNGKAA
jgi:hypothetical protein